VLPGDVRQAQHSTAPDPQDAKQGTTTVVPENPWTTTSHCPQIPLPAAAPSPSPDSREAASKCKILRET